MSYLWRVLTFLGLVIIACVLGYWLRRIKYALIGILAVLEASVNRVASRTGEPPIRQDIPDEWLR